MTSHRSRPLIGQGAIERAPSGYRANAVPRQQRRAGDGRATLGNGSSVTLTVVVRVMAKPGTTLTNTASVSSACPRASNSGTVMTSVVARH
jgi:hypothetical protein